MGIEIPSALRTVAAVMADDFPEGDETAMRRLADRWTDTGKAVQQLATDGTSATRQTLAALDGSTNEAIGQNWTEVRDGLAELQKFCENAADLLDNSASHIEETKLLIIAALVELAVEITIALAQASVTLGAAAAEIPLMHMATKAAVWQIMKQLLARIGRQMALGSVEGSLKAVRDETFSQLMHNKLDIGKIGEEAEKGLYSGLIDGAIAGLAGGKVTTNHGAANHETQAAHHETLRAHHETERDLATTPAERNHHNREIQRHTDERDHHQRQLGRNHPESDSEHHSREADRNEAARDRADREARRHEEQRPDANSDVDRDHHDREAQRANAERDHHQQQLDYNEDRGRRAEQAERLDEEGEAIGKLREFTDAARTLRGSDEDAIEADQPLPRIHW